MWPLRKKIRLLPIPKENKRDLVGRYSDGNNSLDINDQNCSDEIFGSLMEHLRTDTRINYLNVILRNLSYMDVKELSNTMESNRSITSLSLHNTKISEDSLSRLVAALYGNTMLKQLRLTNENIGYEGLNMIFQLFNGPSRISRLYMINVLGSNNNHSTHVNDGLIRTRHLKILDMSYNKFNNNNYLTGLMTNIRNNNSIHTLCMNSNTFTCNQITHIIRTLHDKTELTNLNLKNNILDEYNFQQLTRYMTRLISLNLHTSLSTGKQYGPILKEYLINNRYLMDIDLSDNQTLQYNLNFLSVLEGNKSNLIKITLTSINISSYDNLWYHLETNCILKILDVSKCGLKSKNMFYIEKFIRKNTHLRVLILDHNTFDLNSITILCDAVIHNEVLRELHMKNVSSEDVITEPIDKIIRENQHLLTLNVADNKMDITTIITSLHHNYTLRRLHIFGSSRFTHGFLDSIWEMIRVNISLYYIDYGFTDPRINLELVTNKGLS